ncbi:MAG: glycosyltransferase [Desulfovibrio sp.]|jgi:GT2 family glycosyltransferase|nr:glycosyltransferase [Desulfovibrio sp.]
MHPDYFRLFGVPAELSLLTIEEKIAYVNMLKRLFMLEGPLATTFANSLSTDPAFDSSEPAQQTFLHCIARANQALPMRADILDILQKIAPDEQRARHLEILNKLALPSALDGKTHKSDLREKESDAAYSALLDILAKNPAHAGAADGLLRLDYTLGREPSAWLDRFHCPNRLTDLWRSALFLHYARRGRREEALPLWEQIPEKIRTPYLRVYAADNYILARDRASGVKAYASALRQDPSLHPVSLRLDALLSPPALRTELLREKKTAVCLYSWNKGAVLEQTLRALAKTDTGDSPVFVLLNGCTDDSLPRAEALRELFPERRYEIVTLPVNIGAPAARNWLIRLPEVRACEYVAFMDDDVLMPQDWLVRYLTEMEKDPRTGVVGCKVVFPPQGEDAPVMQYIFRNVNMLMARRGLLKLTIAEPAQGMRDTGLYSFTRRCLSVMGCLHLLRTSALEDAGDFDIRFSPSQVDDIDHDLCLALKGWNIVYCGEVTCEHHQNSGIGTNSGARLSHASIGSILGNDVKLNFKHEAALSALAQLAAGL